VTLFFWGLKKWPFFGNLLSCLIIPFRVALLCRIRFSSKSQIYLVINLSIFWLKSLFFIFIFLLSQNV
jgi:hypothetical protein